MTIALSMERGRGRFPTTGSAMAAGLSTRFSRPA